MTTVEWEAATHRVRETRAHLNQFPADDPNVIAMREWCDSVIAGTLLTAHQRMERMNRRIGERNA